MEILVTGGAGFIGSNLSETLLQSQHRVGCVDNLNDYYNPARKIDNLKILRNHSGFQFYQIDIEDKEAVEEVFDHFRPEVVVHLAARAGVRPSIEHPDLYSRTNVEGTVNILEACRKHDTRNFIFASSSSVYGNCRQVPFREDMDTSFSISPYAATKKAGEALCHVYHSLYGMDVTSLRFFTVYGPRNRPDMAAYKFTDAIFRGDPIQMYGDGLTSRDYTFIDDIIDGIVRSIEYNNGFNIINLGSSSPILLKDFISTLETAIGKKAQIIQKPLVSGDVERTFADISRARSILGWEPHTVIRDGLDKLARWYRST